MAARIGLMEILAILFVVGTTVLIVGSIVFIIKHSLKKRANMEDKVKSLEEKIDELKE